MMVDFNDISLPALNQSPSINRIERGVDKENGSTTKLERSCKDFESIFIGLMMQQMRRTVPQDGLFDGGQAEQLFTSMLDGEMAKSISEQRGVGLAPLLFQQLTAHISDEK